MTDTVKQSTFGTRELTDITADAVAIQERDEFREQGWTKLIAPAKVNLYLAIGEKRPDGYHNAATVLHAINLHDIVYIRRKPGGADAPEARIVAQGDIVAPDLASEDNIACKAVLALAQATGFENEAGLEIRIEKNIPAQAGLGGGSTDAAAALIGAARIWGVPADSSVLEETARHLGADVAFFLHGGCTYLEGTGDTFVRSLEPSKRSIVLVKPDCGVSTGEAYRTFDETRASRTNALQTRSNPLDRLMKSRCSTTWPTHPKRSCPSLQPSGHGCANKRASPTRSFAEAVRAPSPSAIRFPMHAASWQQPGRKGFGPAPLRSDRPAPRQSRHRSRTCQPCSPVSRA